MLEAQLDAARGRPRKALRTLGPLQARRRRRGRRGRERRALAAGGVGAAALPFGGAPSPVWHAPGGGAVPVKSAVEAAVPAGCTAPCAALRRRRRRCRATPGNHRVSGSSNGSSSSSSSRSSSSSSSDSGGGSLPGCGRTTVIPCSTI
jgi:hypothetical protein